MLRLKQLECTEKYSRSLEISQATYKLESRNSLDKSNLSHSQEILNAVIFLSLGSMKPTE